MGLLTDPGVGRGKVVKLLIKHHDKVCALSYIAGVLWFASLAHDNFNAGTYFSENALLPGLVKGDYEERLVAREYLKELADEAIRHPDSIPYSWLLAKFGQLNLETYTHNFTVHYPLIPGTKYTGKNVYAILRAPRSASTEALVLSTPYRPPKSTEVTTMPSVALMLSLAKFFRWQKYWAKDIIFLITEHEQLGVQAWLEAYHRTSCGHPGVLEHGDMMGRAGAIQAAVNLELHAEKIGYVDVKVEGLNGQLPNLDLVNLIHRMCAKEGVKHTFKNRENKKFADDFKEWSYAFRTLMAMVSTQATGVPNGNHGLFLRFGIDAVTIEGFPKTDKGGSSDFYQMGRVLEGVFRSLNNLLERFHQSYFFYLQPATDRYISIGMYMPCLGLLCAGLFIKAFALWLKIFEEQKKERDENRIEQFPDQSKVQEISPESQKQSTDKSADKISETTNSEVTADKQNEVDHELIVIPVGVVFLVAHVFGTAALFAADAYSVVGRELIGLSTDLSVFAGYLCYSLVLLPLPAFDRVVGQQFKSCSLLNIAALLELATLLLAVGMHNFSLSFILATLYVPVALSVSPTKKGRLVNITRRIMWLLLHPLSLLMLTVFTFSAYTFPEEPSDMLVLRTFEASCEALLFAVVDNLIYGNWLFSVAVAALLPVWLLFWVVLHTSANIVQVKTKM
ncbi:glycosylphosphatidylinositol anchor attachment 1 protein [Schistocerca gregaria]|uniref:glycosylphosphatidylinositol anchor attachment 1 protein n=1 Tax=Schistocerca gregaria TaxID=7010 RepID=UPI00211E3BF0|nr:glycosylphosphatidylinositol anchor attachment 1 protein [Schistocerca gregaria]